jgi:hypothetical protein
MIHVWSIPHTMFAARHLVAQLCKLGYAAQLVDSINSRSSDLHIIYGANAAPALPRNYIVYQTEIRNTHHFSGRYLQMLRRALAVWDYSPDNIPAYATQQPNIYLVSPGIAPQPVVAKDIPFMFYGWIDGSPRRMRMLEDIKEYLPLRIVTNTLGDNMWKMLARTHVVINLHYHAHSPLECFRVHEALSFGCKVVTEGPLVEKYRHALYWGDDAQDISLFAWGAYRDLSAADLSCLDNLEEVEAAIKNIKTFL